mgnify:CR=1 FL=1
MPRQPRIDYPGAWHHVMNRGARKEPTFLNSEHCSLFLGELGRVVQRFGLEVHAYALMPNHFHLLVRSVRGNLSTCMRHLLGSYTQVLNLKHGWDGPVFRGRFKNQLVLESEHLQVLVPYIHLNPVRARLVLEPSSSLWCSYTDYVGISRPPEWLSTDVVMAMYESREQLIEETRAYRLGELPWPMDFDVKKGLFTRKIVAEVVDEETRSDREAYQVDVVKEIFRTVTDREWSEVLQERRGRHGNPARRFAIWLFLQETDLDHGTIGKAVGATRSQVAMTIHRLRRSPFEDEIGKWVRSAQLWIMDREDERKRKNERV